MWLLFKIIMAWIILVICAAGVWCIILNAMFPIKENDDELN